MTKSQSIAPARLTELVAQARTNLVVDHLYQAVHARSPITFNASNSSLWGSKTDTNGTYIDVAETAYASESLAHELLHAEFKLDGHRTYLGHYSCVPRAQSKILQQVLFALDNELQHHRMFGKFTSLGLNPNHFYSDSDRNAYEVARRDVKRLKSNALREHFLLPFLTVIAKGGMGQDKVRSQLRNFIRTIAAPATWKALEDIEHAVNQWSTSPSLDAGPTIVQILQHLGGYDRTWIARSNDFPGDGNFVGPSFTIEDMNTYFRSQP